MNHRLIIHVSHGDHQPCPRCLSRQPKPQAIVTEAAGATQFACAAHLAELGKVAELAEPPPPTGSDEERTETALAVGFPGAFDTTSGQVERLIHSRLLWES